MKEFSLSEGGIILLRVAQFRKGDFFMQKTRERKRLFKVISWVLTVAMVLTTMNLSGIGVSIVEAGQIIQLTSENTSFAISEFTYTGTEYEPVVVYQPDEGEAVNLTAGVDYLIEVGTTSKATAAGEYILTISGHGGYDGYVTLNWKISPIELTSDNTSLKFDSIYYAGEEIENTVLYDSGIEGEDPITLEAGTDFTVNGKIKGTNAGSYNVSITGKGNYSGTVSNMKWNIDRIPVIVTPDADLTKVYGEADPTIKYTVEVSEPDEKPEDYVAPVIPEDDIKNGMFKKGIFARTSGEAVGKYAYDFSDIIQKNSNYEITVAENSPEFEITRKQLTDDDVLVVAKRSSGKTEENGFEYEYTGKTVEAKFELYYTTRVVDDNGKKISNAFNPDDPSSEANAAYKLTNDTDYAFYGVTTLKNPQDEPVDVEFRGKGNYQGIINDKWNIVEGTFRVKENVYEGEYDGKEHKALEVHPTPSSEYESEKKEYQYILIKDFDRKTRAKIGSDPEAAWEEYKDQAVSEVPMLKDVNLDEDGEEKDYIVLYKIRMNGYKDYIDVAYPCISKKPVLLESDEVEKVYDNNPETDPELTYKDISDQIAEGETIEGIEIYRDEGQDVGKYSIEYNQDELNEKYPNYSFYSNAAYFTITKRKASISVPGNYEKIYSEPLPEIEVVFEKAGDEGVAEDEGIIPGDEEKIDYALRFVNGHKRTDGGRTTDAGEYDIEISRRTTDENYDLVLGDMGTLTINPKDIKEDSIKILFNGHDDPSSFEFEYTGEKIEPQIALSDFDGDYNYMRNGKEKATGGPKKPDYRIIGTESATEMGAYYVQIEGLNNYTGTTSVVWTILPFGLFNETVYNGKPQSPEFSKDFNPADHKDLFTIQYSSDKKDYSDELPAFTDVKRDKDGDVDSYYVYYKVTYNPDEYGYEDPDTETPKTFNGILAFTINPYEIKNPSLYANKEYDAKTDILVYDVIEAPEIEGKSEGNLMITFVATLDRADSNKVLYDEGELEFEDSYRPVKLTDEQLKAVKILECEGSAANPDNYTVTFDKDKEGHIAGTNVTVFSKLLYDVNSKSEEFDHKSYIAASAENRTYDGTCFVDSQIKVKTGIEGEEINFTDVIGTVESGDVEYEEKDELAAKEVIITGVANGVGDTKLGNYVYVDENGDKPNYIYLSDKRFTKEEEAPDYWAGDLFAKATIEPQPLTVTAEDITKVYDGKEVKVEDVVGKIVGFENVQDDEVAEYYAEKMDTVVGVTIEGKTVKDAGVYKVSASIVDEELAGMLEDNDNYEVQEEDAKVVIAPKAVTVKVEDATKKAGEADPTFKYSVTGLVDGESLKNIKVTRVAGEDAGTYKVSAACDADKNYEITFVDGKLTITAPETNYKNEWVDGQWYDADGKTDYVPKGSWKQNANGWWFEDESGWYPVQCWQKIDGLWYYFGVSGYMAASEWIDGWWCDADGACRYEYQASWKQDSNGWWYEDTSGWYAKSSWQKIDNIWYYFGNDGYMVTNQYVDGYWVNSNGAWAE